MEKFDVRCNGCGETEKIQTTMESDSGYSNWTVMDSGFIEFKCGSCGKFGSTDEYKDKPANDLGNFVLTCRQCRSQEWEAEIGDVDEDVVGGTKVKCKNCDNSEHQD